MQGAGGQRTGASLVAIAGASCAEFDRVQVAGASCAGNMGP